MASVYLSAYKTGLLAKRAAEAWNMLGNCIVCPRKCRVNRLEGEKGICKTGQKASVASYFAHFGEEKPLVGTNGSGTIFFSNCSLLCSFCQNYEISHMGEGVEVSADRLADIMIYLQDLGCHNINFVTPTHVVPQILQALSIAVEKGLTIPLVYNSGGYDDHETLKLLDGIIDIYMPDIKFLDSQLSVELCNVSDYSEVVRKSIVEMHRQSGNLEVNDKGIAVRGLLVRHLLMPDCVQDFKNILQFIKENISVDTYLNIMPQYRACYKILIDSVFARGVTISEYRNAINYARKEGFTNLDI